MKYKLIAEDVETNTQYSFYLESDEPDGAFLLSKIDDLLSNRFDAEVTKSEQAKPSQANGAVAEKFNAIHLWNKAAEFSANAHLTNGYWRALKDLEKLGVIEIKGLEPD